MRLWNTLHRLYGGNTGARRADSTRARLEVEALDQRLLPSSFQWGIGRGVEVPSFDLGKHQVGTLASSHQISGVQYSEIVLTKDHDPVKLRRVVSTQIKLTGSPMESISLNFARPMMSFSWGAVNSHD
jgi:hypothetical protein